MNDARSQQTSPNLPPSLEPLSNAVQFRPTFGPAISTSVSSYSISRETTDVSTATSNHSGGLLSLSNTQSPQNGVSKTRGKGSHPDRFKCPHCPKSLKNASCLNKHLLIHTGNWPLKCETCSKGFLYKFHLTEHMRTHTGERPFTCRYCGKRSAATSTHNAHERKCKDKTAAQRQRLADLERNRRISPAYVHSNADEPQRQQSSDDHSVCHQSSSPSIQSTPASIKSQPKSELHTPMHPFNVAVQSPSSTCFTDSSSSSSSSADPTPELPKVQVKVEDHRPRQADIHHPPLPPPPPPLPRVFPRGLLRHGLPPPPPPWLPPPMCLPHRRVSKPTRVAFPATGAALTASSQPSGALPLGLPRVAGLAGMPPGVSVVHTPNHITPVAVPVPVPMPPTMHQSGQSGRNPKVVTKLVITPVYMFEWN